MMLLRLTDRGLYCEAGDFFVDPWGAVDRAVVTHAHGDHVAWGCRAYLTSSEGLGVLRSRLAPEAKVSGLPWGEPATIRGVRVSFHPAGHILGSAQIRLELGGEVWVVSGDYKTDPDPTTTAFEPVRCHTFVTESTFGLPDLPLAPAAGRPSRDQQLVARQPGGRQGQPALRLRAGQGAAADRRVWTRASGRSSPTARWSG